MGTQWDTRVLPRGVTGEREGQCPGWPAGPGVRAQPMKTTVMMEEVVGPSPPMRMKQHPQGVWDPPSCRCTWLSAIVSLEWGLTQEINQGALDAP